MSLSKKLSAIVIFLVFISFVVAVIGFGSISRINNNTEELAVSSKRLVNLLDMQITEQQRAIGTLRIMLATSSERIKELMETVFKPSEEYMSKVMDEYADQCANAKERALQQKPSQLLTMWADLVKATNEIAHVNSLKTNDRALELVNRQAVFIEDLDQSIVDTIASIDSGMDSKLTAWRTQMHNSRTDAVKYLYYMTRYINSGNTEEEQRFLRIIRNSLDSLLGALQDGIHLPNPYGQKAEMLRNQVEHGLMTPLDEVVSLGAQNSDLQKIMLYLSSVDPAFSKLYNATEELILQGEAALDATAKESVRFGKAAEYLSLCVSSAGIVIGLVVAYFITSRITTMLNDIIGNLNGTSRMVRTVSNQISASSQSLAEGATEQAATLEETSSSLEQMTSMTRQNAESANQTNDSIENTTKLIDFGSQAVANMSQAMGEITDSAEQIGRIIKTIEDVAFQTNLLALNAAVEAARAGDAGKGFAVVADEVKRLAGHSAQAARDTTALIRSTIERVKVGSEIASQLDASFKEIEEGAHNVEHLIASIAAATNEQAQGVNQINTAVAQMDKVTQANAAAAEQAASTTEELAAQSDMLHDVVDELVMLVSGDRGGKPIQFSPSARHPILSKSTQSISDMAIIKDIPMRALPDVGSDNHQWISYQNDAQEFFSAENIIPLEKLSI